MLTEHEPADVAEREGPQELDAVVERRQRQDPRGGAPGTPRRGTNVAENRNMGSVASSTKAKSAHERISVTTTGPGAANAADDEQRAGNREDGPGRVDEAEREHVETKPIA